MAKKSRKIRGRTIPELTWINHTLHKKVDDIILDYTEFRHTAQICAMLCLQANGDRGVVFNDNRSEVFMARIESHLKEAAELYAEISDIEEGPEEKHRIGL